MKKIGITLALCAAIFSANGFAQKVLPVPLQLKGTIEKSEALLKSGIVGSYPQHTIEYDWTTDSVLSQTIETSYTAFGEPQTVEFNKNGNRTRNLYTYDTHQRQTEMISQTMTGGVWVNSTRETATYNAAGMETETDSYTWNGASWAMQSGTQTAFEMDGDRIHIATKKDWNADSSTWVNSTRETYTYTAPGAAFATVVTETWSTQWDLSTKAEYSWNTTQVTQVIAYDYTDNAWVLSMKMVYEYTNAFTTVMTMYTPDGGGGWTPATRITSTVDSHHNLTLTQTEMYFADWTVFMGSRYQLTYSGNNLTQRITQSISFLTGSVWTNVKKEDFSNFASLSTDITVLPNSGISVFPNPAGKQATVRISVLNPGLVSLQLISISGQAVLEESFTANGTNANYMLNLDRVSKGSYLLIARDKQGTEIGKTRLIKE